MAFETGPAMAFSVGGVMEIKRSQIFSTVTSIFAVTVAQFGMFPATEAAVKCPNYNIPVRGWSVKPICSQILR